MYKNYFELREAPFTIAPDPRYLYMSERHREALAHLLYGFKYEGGFVLLTGEVGTGKTTVCRCLLDQIPTDTDVALILNPRLTVPELLASICNEFSIEVPKTNSVKELVDAINRFLLDCNQKGKKAVLVLDEAQNLSCEVLDQIRLLTNLETNTRKLLQIIMLGQPELLDTLARPEMRQLSQRITARYHLGTLSASEVKEYVQHRWKVAGGRGELLDDRQIGRLYVLSGGVPRVINVICDRILLGAYSQDERKISMETLKKAAREVLGEVGPRRRIVRQKNSRLLWGALAIAGVFFIFGLAWRFMAHNTSPGKPSRPPIAESSSSAPKATLPSVAVSSKGVTNGLVDDPTTASPTSLTPQKLTAANAASPASGTAMDWHLKGLAQPTMRKAFDDLFAQWGLIFPGSEPTACGFADKSGLKCLFKVGSLKDLFAVNRPAVLEMSSDEGVKFFAAIVRLDRQQAFLMVDGKERRAPADQLARHWSGRYITFWKPPPGYDGPIMPGTEGPAARWLAQCLEKTGEKAVSPKPSSDDLEREVKQFQIKAGLVPDGIAGEQTIMQLNSRTDIKVPRLHGVAP